MKMYACSHKTEDEANKFRKNVRSFLTFNLVIFILMFLGIGGAGLWKISIIWGAILAIKGRHYFDKCEDDEPRQRDTPPSREQYGRPRRPEWKDKDLV